MGWDRSAFSHLLLPRKSSQKNFLEKMSDNSTFAVLPFASLIYKSFFNLTFKVVYFYILGGFTNLMLVDKSD